MLGANIKEYLAGNGIKQSFLVEKTGISSSKISDICTGRRKDISAVEYFKICNALGVNMEYFFEVNK
jgi:transcriptional regulator with XRE-family HTH domain